MTLSALPIDAILPQVVASLRRHPCLVLRAPPGAGKTTRVPPALLDGALADQGRIVLLQPRRLAATAAALRLAAERGSAVGDEIGYHVRFDRRVGPRTRIVAMTEGILIRQLQDDPLLEQTDVVIFDEFHERTLDADLALGMVRMAQAEVRPDLKLVIMSATMATGPIAHYLGDCPVLDSPGRLYPVQIHYLRHARQDPLEQAVADAVQRAIDDTPGDILVFLPGQAEIRRAARSLEDLAASRDLAIMPLYGDLPLAEQQAVLGPGSRRKVVLATNVAETSITIDGVTAVVDSGLARVLRQDVRLGLNRLEIERVSQASVEQRAGRAGRQSPGVCYRLWTEREQQGLPERASPEIERADLAGPLLTLLAWGERDVSRWNWFEPPPAAAMEQAGALLARLGAVRDGQLTDLGRRMAQAPVHPRIARLLVEGQRLGHADRAALLAALLSERDPLDRTAGPVSHHSASDVLDRLAVLEAWRRGDSRRGFGGLNPTAARHTVRVGEQLARLFPSPAGANRPPVVPADEALRRALWAAFPDRLARRREPGARRAVMVGGRGVRLADQSAVMDAELFVCVDLEEIGKAESLVRQASAVERDWLPTESLDVTVDVEFDAARERVIGVRRTRIEDLVLDQAVTSVPPGALASEVLAREAALRLDRDVKLDEAAQQFLARVDLLRRRMPEFEWPAFADNPLLELLPELCRNCLSLEDVRRAPLLPALRARLTPAQQAALDREAPERLTVPSGSRIALEYRMGQAPVLAVRIQEIFGLEQTPRVAGGRATVLMRLLAPNMRPQQDTEDLSSFWTNTYPVVRKELRRRYPKHAWPEDPRIATPRRRPGSGG